MSPELLLTIGMFGSLIVCIMFGVALGFALGGIAVITALIMWGPAGLMPIVTGVFNYMWMLLLAAVPLFIFIGVALAQSNIARDMYEVFYLWSGPLRGGLAVGSSCFAAALSAMTGNNSASTITAGLVGIPPMRKFGYNESIILGTVGSAGTLGILIPPSITLVVIGMMTGQSVGKLFAGGLTAGLLVLFLFVTYILLRAWLNPALCPARAEPAPLGEKMRALKGVALPILVMLAILGTIFLGVATPTEAAAVGSLAVVLAVMIRGEFDLEFIKSVSYNTARITGMVLWIMFGASGFVAIYTGGGGVQLLQQYLLGWEVNRWVIFVLMQAIVFILGMFIDPMAIIFITLPVFYPIVQALHFDPIWFGVLFQVNLCIGYITPPFGYNLFYLKSLCPEADMKTIYASLLPFIGLMLIAMVLMVLYPPFITWLPSTTVAK